MFKSDALNLFNEEIHKIALSFNDDKRLQPLKRVNNICMKQAFEKYATKNFYNMLKQKHVNIKDDEI